MIDEKEQEDNGRRSQIGGIQGGGRGQDKRFRHSRACMQEMFDGYEMAGEGSLTAEMRGAVVRETVRAGVMKTTEKSGERQSSGRASSKGFTKISKKTINCLQASLQFSLIRSFRSSMLHEHRASDAPPVGEGPLSL